MPKELLLLWTGNQPTNIGSSHSHSVPPYAGGLGGDPDPEDPTSMVTRPTPSSGGRRAGVDQEEGGLGGGGGGGVVRVVTLAAVLSVGTPNKASLSGLW